jgi:hypothetical protein
VPDAETTEEEMITWYAHARAYAEAKWPSLAPVSRRSVAEALVTVTIAQRLALGACARNLNGKPAAGSTQRRKRSLFYNSLGYAVEPGGTSTHAAFTHVLCLLAARRATT